METKVLTDFRICVGVPFVLLPARAGYLVGGGGSGFPMGWRTAAGGGGGSIFWGSFASIGKIIFLGGMGTGHWIILPWGFDII